MNRGGGKSLLYHQSVVRQHESESSSDSDDDIEDDLDMAPTNVAHSSANLSSSEEEGEEISNSRKRPPSDMISGTNKRQNIASSLFVEEAEADDDNEEEEEEESDPHDVVKKHYTEDDIRRENMDDEAQEIIRRQNQRRQKTSLFTSNADVEDIARQFEERNRREKSFVERRDIDEVEGGQGGRNDLSTVTQQSLLPSVSDPSLWMFKCSTGKEQELVFQIMNKSISFARQGKSLGITSAVAAQSKGRIYIESFSEPGVMEAIDGMRSLLQYTKTLVPINDMTTVMTVQPKKKPVEKNQLVRMTRGHFKGDLALVREVRPSGLKCVIQCVPRLDLALSDLSAEDARIRRRNVRPAQKFFNAQDLTSLGKHAITRERFPGMGDVQCDVFENNYYHDGYLLKEVTVSTMIKPCGDDDPPSLDELQRFSNKPENEGSKLVNSMLQEREGQHTSSGSPGSVSGLLVGDTVEVIEGDLVGMRGKISSMDGTTVKVKPTNTSDLGESTVEFLIGQVRKLIMVGAHVKIIGGRYANETGDVVAVEEVEGEVDSTVVVLTDVTNKQLTVRVSQLQESSDVRSGQEKLAGYELHDLVVLSGGGTTNEVGVIVRVGREDFTVMNNHGIIREVRPEELRGKRNGTSSKAVALDAQGNQIRVGDSVLVVEGPHKGKVATIKRLNRAQLFLYSQTRTEHAGILVVRSRSCQLAGNPVQKGTGVTNIGQSPMSTPRSNGTGGSSGRRADDGLTGKTVRIQAGNWKGYLGTVSDATPTHVQVELHSRLKKVMVVREKVTVIGDKFGATETAEREVTTEMMTAPTTPFLGGTTPMHGGATPMHGGATPMHHGGATPMHASATPMHSDSSSGNFVTSHTVKSDEVWRPGSSIDRSEVDIQKPEEDSEWVSTTGASSIDNPPTFLRDASHESDGWNSTSTTHQGAWTSATTDDERTISIKQESHHDIDSSAMAAADDEEVPVWFMERVQIQVKKTECVAVIREVNGNVGVVELEDHTTISVSCGEVSMIAPKEHDTVLVTGGADVGVEAELVCIDNSDAILKDSNDDYKIVDFVHLAKIVTNE